VLADRSEATVTVVDPDDEAPPTGR
jgi:hypothetical protein